MTAAARAATAHAKILARVRIVARVRRAEIARVSRADPAGQAGHLDARMTAGVRVRPAVWKAPRARMTDVNASIVSRRRRCQRSTFAWCRTPRAWNTWPVKSR